MVLRTAQYPLPGSRTSLCEEHRLSSGSFMSSGPHSTFACMYFGLPVVTKAVGLILAKFTIPVGLSGSQLPPPPRTGITHQRSSLAVKNFSAACKTLFTCPLFWQIKLPRARFPASALPEQLPAVVNPALMSGAPEEQSKKVVQQAFSPAGFSPSLVGCCICILTSYSTPFCAHTLDHKAIGIDGFDVMTETALTLTLLAPGAEPPNSLNSGVRNAGVAIALPVACSKATRTPFAVAIGSE